MPCQGLPTLEEINAWILKNFNIWNIIKVLILVLATGDIFELDQRSRINIWVMLGP